MDSWTGARGSVRRTPADGAERPPPEDVSFWAVRCYPEARRARGRARPQGARIRSRSRDQGHLARAGEPPEDRAHRTIVISGTDQEVGQLLRRLTADFAEVKPRRVDAVAWVGTRGRLMLRAV